MLIKGVLSRVDKTPFFVDHLKVCNPQSKNLVAGGQEPEGHQ